MRQSTNPQFRDSDFLMKCNANFEFFCRHVLNLDFSQTGYHSELCMLPLQNRYLCIVIPTGHSKTTIFSIAYPLWRLYKDQGIEICLVSSSIDQSMKILAKVQRELETNEFFQHLLPTNRFETWNKSQLVTSNNNTYFIKPFNSTARGMHPNIIIYDDLLREDNIMDMVQSKEIFWGIFYPRGQIHSCQHIVVGTPQSQDDLYTDIEKKGGWSTVRKSAVIEDSNGKWIGTLWPEMFSMETLSEIRNTMTDYRFEREYMCRPRSTGDMLYPQEMILNCLDYGLDFGYDASGVPYIGCDFAMSVAASGDYNVFTVVDALSAPYQKHLADGTIKEIENAIVIRKIVRFRGNVGHTENIKNLNEYFKAAKIIVDESGVGAKFVQELREQYITVDAQNFRPANRNLMLMNLRRLVETERLVIPAMSENDVGSRLIFELSSFRATKTPSGTETFKSIVDHDDMVMSLALAVKDIVTPRKMMDDCIFGA
jgi:hypothetical protein